jgi:hypothetical protein
MSTMRRYLESGGLMTKVRRVGGPTSQWGLFFWDSSKKIYFRYGKAYFAPKGWTHIPEFGTYKTETIAIKEAIDQFGHEPRASKMWKRQKMKESRNAAHR